MGAVIGYEGAIADITNRKQAELERIELLDRERQAREEAEAVNRIKDEFLATLSHELRTPLNAIMGWMQLLQSGKLSPSQTDKALDAIDRNARAQNQLINDLLDVSHIIRGTFKLELEPVNLVEVIKASLDTVSPGIKAKNIEVITQYFWHEVIVVNGDEKRLQQVFWNLFLNAVKFTPENGTITINLKVRERSVLIEVTDTGQGISAEVLPYVFDSEKEKSSILAIALTACASKEDKQRAYSAGFNLHISKPVQFDKLIESLLSLCSQSSR